MKPFPRLAILKAHWLLLFLWIPSAASSALVLSGAAFNATSILWTWTPDVAGSSFSLLNSTGGLVATLAGTASSFIDAGLPNATAIQRQLVLSSSGGTATSPVTTVATPDNSVAVPQGFPISIVGSDGVTRAALGLNALAGPGEVSVSQNPLTKPLVDTTPALITAANTQPPPNYAPVSASLREFTVFTNGSLFTGPFRSLVSIQVPYSDVNNTGNVDGVSGPMPATTLALFTIDPASRQWVLVPGSSVNLTTKVVTGNPSHFSVFGIFGISGTGDNLNGLKVYPSPWRPGTGGAYDDPRGIHFHGLSASATIKIFTIAGSIVRRFDKQPADGSEIIWNGQNSDGSTVASGIYLYLVTNPATKQQVKGRIGIIR